MYFLNFFFLNLELLQNIALDFCVILKLSHKILNNRVKWVVNISHPISFLSTFFSTLRLTSCTFPTPPCSKLKLKWLIILISYHPYPNSKTISNHLIASAAERLNGICKPILSFKSKRPTPAELVKFNYCQKICNCATVWF